MVSKVLLTLKRLYNMVRYIYKRGCVICFEGPPGSLYAGEIHRLQFVFNENYPLESPEVVRLNFIRLTLFRGIP